MRLPRFIFPAFAALFLSAAHPVLAFGPYYSPYDGSATVTTGKKKGILATAANATTSDGSDASVVVSGQGTKGIRINVQLLLLSSGKGSLTLSAKVLADPKAVTKGGKMSAGKKVVVKIRAKGTYTVVDPGTVSLNFSGNAGKGGGTNITGTLSTDGTGNLSLRLKSGFKQKVNGVGRRLAFEFAGVSSTMPSPTATPLP